jgi:plasmid stabilization system protein ParE
MVVVAWHRLAAVELNEAADFLASKRPGLRDVFLSEAERCVAAISEHPEAGHLIASTVRRSMFRRFPYAILYSRGGSEIRILAVMHLRRRPSYWNDRLEPEPNDSR